MNGLFLSMKQIDQIIDALDHNATPMRRMATRIALQNLVAAQKPENHICAFNRAMDGTCFVCGKPTAPQSATHSAMSDPAQGKAPETP